MRAPRSYTRSMRIRLEIVLAVIAASLIVVPAASAGGPLAPGKIGYATVQPVCPPPAPGAAACSALTRTPVPASEAGSPGVEAYKVDDGASDSGAGGRADTRTSSRAPTDTNRPRAAAGRRSRSSTPTTTRRSKATSPNSTATTGSPACTTANGCFTKVGQTGSTTALPQADTSGWSVEITLDVETVHSRLSELQDPAGRGQQPTRRRSRGRRERGGRAGATEVSNSYGGPEGEELEAARTGRLQPSRRRDRGRRRRRRLRRLGRIDEPEGFAPPNMPDTPASLPIRGRGRRHLAQAQRRRHARERDGVERQRSPTRRRLQANSRRTARPAAAAAPCSRARLAAGGAGLGRHAAAATKRLDSRRRRRRRPATPALTSTTATTAASLRTRTAARLGDVGGTSLATPLISSLYALAAAAGGVSYPAPTLYGHLGDAAALFDVTEGGNGFCDGASEFACGDPDECGYFGALALHVDCEDTTACNAATGFDGPSGVGTPNGLALFKPLESRQEEEAAAARRPKAKRRPRGRAEEEAALDEAGDEAAARTVREAAEAAARAAALSAQAVSAFKASGAAVLPTPSSRAPRSGEPLGRGDIEDQLPGRREQLRGHGHPAHAHRRERRRSDREQEAAILTLAAGSFTVAGGKVAHGHAAPVGEGARAARALRTLRARATLLAHDPRAPATPPRRS